MRLAVAAALACVSIVSLTAVADAQASIKRFTDIPPQALGSALQELAKERRLSLVYVSEDLRSLRSEGAVGELTAEEALKRVLEGTGFTFKYVNEQTVTIVPVASQPAGREAGNRSDENAKTPVPVTDTYAQRSGGMRLAQAQTARDSADRASDATPPASDKLEMETVSVFGRGVVEQAQREVPQVIDVFSEDFIQSIQADIADDVIRFVPNSHVSSGSPPLFTAVVVRGFGATQTYDGLVSPASGGVPASMVNIERVEVLKGPASVLYGTMEPGAVINFVTKTPPKQFEAGSSLKYGTYEDATLTFNVGGPLSERIGGRLDFSYDRTDSLRDNLGTVENVFVAPVVELNLSDASSLILDGYYRRNYWPNGWTDGTMPFQLAGLDSSAIARFPESTNFAYDQNATGNSQGYGDLQSTRTQREIRARFSHDFSDALSINAVLSHHRAGNYNESLSPGLLDPDNRSVPRYYVINDQPETSYVARVDLSGEAFTGPLRHRWSIGIERSDDDLDTAFAAVPVTSIDAFEPVYGTVVLPGVIDFPLGNSRTKTSDIFLQDRIRIGKWSFLAGARFSDYEQRTENSFGGTTTRSGLDDNIVSSQGGIVYDVSDRLSLFASRNESFVPKALITPAGIRTSAPEISVQYEAGLKLRSTDARFNAHVAWFSIEKNDLLVADPLNPGFQRPFGQVTSDGFEVSLDSRPVPGLTMLLAYGYNDTEVTRADAFVGNGFYNTPKYTLAAFTRYDLQSGPMAGLGFSGSLNYVGPRWASEENLIEYPAYTRVDLMGHYPVSERAELSLQVENLMGARIFEGYGSLIARYTEDRRVFGKVTYRFR